MTFREKYGPWAVVAGASEGLGAAFAHALAKRGLHVALLARREAELRALATELEAAHKVETKVLVTDLATTDFSALRELDVGLGVYNAAYSFVGPLLEKPLDDALRVVDVNIRGPLKFAHAVGPRLLEEKRGGLILMSSLAGFQGNPRLATYAASKAFNIVLAEGLWGELKAHGVDVLASCPGAIRTPNYLKTMADGKEAPGILDASHVAESSLDALGGGPTFIPGGVNKLARFFLGRMLSRRGAVGVMAANTRDLQ